MRLDELFTESSKLGFTIPAYHGTTENFDEFDPRRTGDIGLHFGTAEQADNATKLLGQYQDGANIIPVLLRLHKILRVRDQFSTLRSSYVNRAKTWTLLTPGFSPSDPERAAIYGAAKAADKARRSAGGDWGALRPKLDYKQESYKEASARFWKEIEKSAIRQGYDGLVYANRIEGKGDSYVVFDPKNVRARHARFDGDKTNSANLLDHREIEIDEKYTHDNGALLQYMKNREFDPYSYWYLVCEWLVKNDYLDEMKEIIGKSNPDASQIEDADDLAEYEPDFFYSLPKNVQKECGDELIGGFMASAPFEAPTWAHMSLKKQQLIGRSTWLVHFTNNARDIAYNGFVYGMDNMDRLGLTAWVTKNGKPGGYNFAFIADSRDAERHNGKYGNQAVLFQNSGVHAYHYGDQEDQIMFFGKDVNPHDIIVLTHAR